MLNGLGAASHRPKPKLSLSSYLHTGGMHVFLPGPGLNDLCLALSQVPTLTQAEVDQLYLDQDEWTRRSILYTAGSGFFSSDRTIKQYADEIWDVKPVPLPSS